jgi:Transposase IS4
MQTKGDWTTASSGAARRGCYCPYPTRGQRNGPLLAPKMLGSLGIKFFPHQRRTTPFNLSSTMDLRRSKRTPKPKTIWEEKGAPSAASDPKITKKTARTAQETALKPIITGPLPEIIELDENDLRELPTYKPPLNLQFQASESLATGLSELDTFQRLLTPTTVSEIVIAINNYAKNARKDEEPLPCARLWISVNSTDIWRFIGCLLHMGYHKLSNHGDHWSKSGYLCKFITLRRYDQIYRYFTLRDTIVYPQKEEETFVWKVEPIATIIKQNCKALWLPSSHLAIDEAMIAYRGRTLDKVKLPNKLIKEGYKV